MEEFISEFAGSRFVGFPVGGGDEEVGVGFYDEFLGEKLSVRYSRFADGVSDSCSGEEFVVHRAGTAVAAHLGDEEGFRDFVRSLSQYGIDFCQLSVHFGNYFFAPFFFSRRGGNDFNVLLNLVKGFRAVDLNDRVAEISPHFQFLRFRVRRGDNEVRGRLGKDFHGEAVQRHGKGNIFCFFRNIGNRRVFVGGKAGDKAVRFYDAEEHGVDGGRGSQYAPRFVGQCDGMSECVGHLVGGRVGRRFRFFHGAARKKKYR